LGRTGDPHVSPNQTRSAAVARGLRAVSSPVRPAARLGRTGDGRPRRLPRRSAGEPAPIEGRGASGAGPKGASMIRIVTVLSLMAVLVSAALESDAEAQMVITGTVRSKAGQPLPGLALLEKGEIHNNVWDRGARVDAQGRFRIEVTSVGAYGLHVYS